MRSFLASLLSIFILSFPLGTFAGEEKNEVLEELRALKERIAELEVRLSQMEAKQETVKEISEELSGIKEALKGIEIGFSATSIVLGTIGNSDNKDPETGEKRHDRVDGAIKASVEVSKEVLEGGRVAAVIEAVQGGRTSERLSSWWGVEGVVGEYVEEVEFDLPELWYEQGLLNGRLWFTLGKVDLSNYFDANEVAGDETTQFLSPGFVHSVAIDFPDNGLGLRITLSPTETWEISLGWGEDDLDELGEESFAIGEVAFRHDVSGFKGSYRIYGWWKDLEDAPEDGWGLGLSADLEILHGVKGFLRVGYQNEDVYPFDWAWSLGMELSGGFWGRDGDALGVAYGMAFISSEYEDEEGVGEDEKHLELYYRLQLGEHLALSPDLQVVWDAEGRKDFDPVVVLGVRGHVEF